ncbi:hypothetical protein LMK08_11115 [Metapseudomonas furukawaii]|uniref:hypothetical protein n=1 Tax=Metapseudomonas furukawaii TaxID=1149133 RepID=UPI00227C679D|nr:hypothetical protein [Pseudomonas furukawaii]WAG81174.1 hypothetical protein LMK08_11115 [Pseudomonas furukawaii]
MKKIVQTAAVLVMASLPVAWVAGAEPAGDSPKPAEAAAQDDAAFDKQLETVRKQMDAMQQQMQKIQETRDPKERQKLLNEHWNSMQSTMAAMQDLWGCGMRQGGMGMGMGMGMQGRQKGMMGGAGGACPQMGGHYSGLTPEQMRQHQYRMDHYLGMQQMMMHHMMWHQHYRNGAPAQTP